MTNIKPRFITLEGIDGCGKSTQAVALVNHLRAIYGHSKVVHTSEPNRTEAFCKELETLAHKFDGKLDPKTELMLYEANRIEHIKSVIAPSLAAGAYVVCDRFTDSTIAYQSFGQGLPIEDVIALNNMACEVDGVQIIPDATLIIDIPIEVAMQRNKGYDCKDKMAADFYRKCRDYYLSCVKKHPEKYILIDGYDYPDEVESQIFSKLITFSKNS